jgi:hypothetical protein
MLCDAFIYHFNKMEKLKLKHIAPYLPYGLQYIYKGKIAELVNIHYFYSHDEYGNVTGKSECTIVICPRFNEVQSLITAIKPILRPLSDLTKEIEIEGKKFVPFEWLLQYNPHTKDTKPCAVIENGVIEMQYYRDYQKLFEWHFDVFGLIDKGLAVDYNTVFPKNDVL